MAGFLSVARVFRRRPTVIDRDQRLGSGPADRSEIGASPALA
jgi:hypothetical protein